MNILAIVGTVLALAGAIFGILEATVKKFVEVFLPLESGKGAELSCRIGYLGVYEAGYDPSCLSTEVLEASNVPTESFTAPTTKFKLLFPAQQGFIKDILPINEQLIGVFGAGLGPNVTQSLQEQYAAATPEFTDCNEYMAELQLGLLSLFGTFDFLLRGAFLQLGVQQVLEQLPTQDLANGLAQVLPGVRVNLTDGANNQALLVGAIYAISGAETICGVAVDDVLDATSAPCAAGHLGGAATLLANQNLTASALLASSVAAVVSPACISVIGCAEFHFDLDPSKGIVDDSPEKLCDAFPNVTCSGGLSGVAGVLSVVAGELATILPSPQSDLLSLLSAGYQAIAVTGFFKNLKGQSDSSVIDFLNETLPSYGLSDFYPSSFANTTYVPCHLNQLAKTSLIANATAAQKPILEAVLSAIPDEGANCTFINFLQGMVALGTAQEQSPNGEDNPFLPVITDLITLYGACEKFVAGPGGCAAFFPSLFLSGAYSFSLDLSQFSGIGDAVFAQGLQACEDDETDIQKISTAQALVPVAIVAIFLGAIAGVVGALTNNVLAVAAACVLSLAGGVLNLAALLDVQSAPVYDTVGLDPVQYQPLYLAGITQVYGLIMIACGVIASIVFGVSLAPCLKKGDAVDSKELKVAE